MKESSRIRDSLNHVLSGVFTANLAKKWLQKVKSKGGLPGPYAVVHESSSTISRTRLLERCDPHVLRNGCVQRPSAFMECPNLSGHNKAHIAYRLSQPSVSADSGSSSSVRVDEEESHSAPPTLITPVSSPYMQLVSVNCSLPIRGSAVRLQRWVGRDGVMTLQGPVVEYRISQVNPDNTQWRIVGVDCDGDSRRMYAMSPMPLIADGSVSTSRKRKRTQLKQGHTDILGSSAVDQAGNVVWVTLRNWSGEEEVVQWPHRFRCSPHSQGESQSMEPQTCLLETLRSQLPVLCIEAGSSMSASSDPQRGILSAAGRVLQTVDDVDRVLQSYRVTPTTPLEMGEEATHISESKSRGPSWNGEVDSAGNEEAQGPSVEGLVAHKPGPDDGLSEDEEGLLDLDLDGGALNQMLLGLDDMQPGREAHALDDCVLRDLSRQSLWRGEDRRLFNTVEAAPPPMTPSSPGRSIPDWCWCVAEQIVLAEMEAEEYLRRLTRFGECNWVIAEEAGRGGANDPVQVTAHADCGNWTCQFTDELPTAVNTVIGSCAKVSRRSSDWILKIRHPYMHLSGHDVVAKECVVHLQLPDFMKGQE